MPSAQSCMRDCAVRKAPEDEKLRMRSCWVAHGEGTMIAQRLGTTGKVSVAAALRAYQSGGRMMPPPGSAQWNDEQVQLI